MKFQEDPIIIIGAGRSGTNILRDVLTSFDEFVTWPCDEINYIWRHGNRSFLSDAFTADMARPDVANYIRTQFGKLARRHPGASLVEKTCANTLRVSFLHQIFPKARFIQLIRDGRDVALSAAERWKAPLDMGYVLKKAKYVPKSDLWYYATRYLLNRFHRLTSREKRIATWGPRFTGMEEVFRSNPVQVACAIQWKHCVESAAFAFKTIPKENVHSLKYEDLAFEPGGEFERLFKFLELSPSESMIGKVSKISNKSVGRWRANTKPEISHRVSEKIHDTLVELGYEK
ncbi:MAG: sulfotransferase family protein [Limisphaerales bacterium]